LLGAALITWSARCFNHFGIRVTQALTIFSYLILAVAVDAA